jgi:hypothetical protein
MKRMDETDIAELIYDTMRPHASSEQMARAIDLMLEFKTNDKLFQNVVIIMAMIHANQEGH